MLTTKLKSVVWLALFLLYPSRNSHGAQSLPDTLLRISENVAAFHKSLPDFVCTEKITSQTQDKKGQTIRKTVVESMFRGVQQPDGKGRYFIESRELTAVDGWRATKSTIILPLPFQYGGGYSSVLWMTFSPENLQYHTYKATGTEIIGNSNVVVIEFATVKGQTKVRTDYSGTEIIDKDAGRAWILPSSMQVLRLQRNYLNAPNLSSFSVTVEYAEFDIGGKRFWMPKTVKADARESKSKESKAYVAEYSNCRRFVATVEIKPGIP